MTKDDLLNMVDQHWNYSLGLINKMVSIVEYSYKTAMIHGIKHGMEIASNEAENQAPTTTDGASGEDSKTLHS